MEYMHIESILIQLQYLASITVRIEQLKDIEYKHGSVTSWAHCRKKILARVFRV